MNQATPAAIEHWAIGSSEYQTRRVRVRIAGGSRL